MVPGSGGVATMQRIPLPGAELLEEEPLYVNAKQYHRILKRRQARARLEAEGKIPKERKVGLICIVLASWASKITPGIPTFFVSNFLKCQFQAYN